MLTNTASARNEDLTAPSAATIAIEDAEQRWHSALQDIAGLLSAGELDELEAAELEADLAARCTTRVRHLELDGEQGTDPLLWARWEARAARRRAAADAERRRSPRLRGLGPRARALRERQMCVVATARVETEVLRWMSADDDEDTRAARRDLAAAGLL
jgi:hypothetical protein